MHSRAVNEARFRFAVLPAGPLLIRSGSEDPLDPTRPDMECVRSIHPATGKESVVIPGSSLKGVFRSRAEQLLRGFLYGSSISVCNPLDRKAACGRQKAVQEASGPQRYLRHCPACQLFGSLALGGRVYFRDAFPAPAHPVVLGERKNVAIDRVTGGARGGALFGLEVVESARFEAEMVLSNYDTWQLCLLAVVLDDLNQGFIGLGSGTSRGYGRVTIRDVVIALRDYRAEPPGQVTGYEPDDRLPVPVAWTRRAAGFEGEISFEALLAAAREVDYASAIRREGGGGR